MKLKYGDYQIIKHGLQERLKREGISEKDERQETKLLNKVEAKIEQLKEEWGI
ncbi:hypothetical protein [Alkalicoccobacillus gibsonii]|uniref:hypothetical protein n=1 Tax=Alkalicoccobacillus gibsonii TaxID=79881 RepID=UPI0035144B0D